MRSVPRPRGPVAGRRYYFKETHSARLAVPDFGVMGISYLGARMMWDARQRGVCFDKVLTLGHQALRLFPSEVAFFRNVYRQTFDATVTPIDGHRWEEYVDGFLRDFLGSTSISVLDASVYEGADTIHDMNSPVPKAWHGQYDVVIDGGSLEHIFNVPVAFANLANMLKVGGTIFINTPANNLMGHGFYQFSPELMFRVFSEANGFAIQDVLLYEAGYPSVELTKKNTVYKVIDPDSVRQRVGLMNKKAVMMMVEAKKVRAADMFATPPLQSDYVAMWETAEQGAAVPSLRQRAIQTVRALPIAIRAPILGYRQKSKFTLNNTTFYKRQRWLP